MKSFQETIPQKKNLANLLLDTTTAARNSLPAQKNKITGNLKFTQENHSSSDSFTSINTDIQNTIHNSESKDYQGQNSAGVSAKNTNEYLRGSTLNQIKEESLLCPPHK